MVVGPWKLPLALSRVFVEVVVLTLIGKPRVKEQFLSMQSFLFTYVK